jgi:cytidine deaminase
MNNLTKKMMQEAYKALSFSYAPYSKYTVASCLCSDKDNLYTGVNVENSSYGLTICAEASAICNMVSSGERHIKSIVILSGTHLLCPPCGACRQRIYEFSSPDTQIHLCNEHTVFKTMTISELLPLAFDFNPKLDDV